MNLNKIIGVIVSCLCCGGFAFAQAFVQDETCDFSFSAGSMARGIRCGTVSVPKRFENPEAGNYKIAVAIIPGQVKSSEATIYLAGGPGSSSAKLGLFLDGTTFDRFSARGDFILFDQRGTGLSEPKLECTKADLPNPNPFNCKQLLTKAKIELGDISTERNARDVEALRIALGYETLNIIGISYGSLLGQHVLRFAKVRSAVLDGVVISSTNWAIDSMTHFSSALRNVFRICQENGICKTKYPNLELLFVQAFERIKKSPRTIKIGDVEITLTTVFARIILDSALRSGNRVSFIPLELQSWANDQTGFLTQQFLEAFAKQDLNTPISLSHFAYACPEAYLVRQTSDVEQALLNTFPILIEDTRGNFNNIVNICNLLNFKPRLLPAVSSQVPTLFLSGLFDPITAPSNAEKVKEQFSVSQHVIIQDDGHGTSFTDCGSQMIAKFFNTPEKAVDSSCAQKSIVFL